MNVNGYNVAVNFSKSFAKNIQSVSLNQSFVNVVNRNNQNDVYESEKAKPFQNAKKFFNRLFSSCNPKSQFYEEISPIIEKQDSCESLDSNLPADEETFYLGLDENVEPNMKTSNSIIINNKTTHTDCNFTSTYSPKNETPSSISPFYPHSYDSKEEIIKKIFKTTI